MRLQESFRWSLLLLVGVLGLSAEPSLSQAKSLKQKQTAQWTSVKPVVIFPDIQPVSQAEASSSIPGPATPAHAGATPASTQPAPWPVSISNPEERLVLRLQPQKEQTINAQAHQEEVDASSSQTVQSQASPIAYQAANQALVEDMSRKMPAGSNIRVYDKTVDSRPNHIAAVMTNARGETIYLHPRSEAIPAFSFQKKESDMDVDGYNTLFEAETSPRSAIQHWVSNARTAHRNKQYPQALQALEHALQLDPDNADLMAAMGEVQWESHYKQEALDSYRQAVKYAPDRHRLRYAQILALSGRKDEAITTLKTPLPGKEQAVQRAYLLGTLYEEQGRLSDAFSYLAEAARLQPDSADIQYNLGLNCELRGETLQAYEHYRKAHILEPDAADVKQALARVKH